MPEFTQANRPIRVDTALGEDVLLLTGFNGLEGISQTFSFQLDLVSTRADIDPADLLRTGARLSVQVTDTETRFIHGIVSRFSQGGKRDDLVYYRAEIVPWLWFLTLSRESRIYQEQSVPDILEEVFKRLQYSDFELRLNHTYQPRLYCVQYRESHLAFVSRLMEEEGIWYFFEHTEEKHLLVITDDSSASAACVGPESIRFAPEGHPEEYVVTELEREHSVHAGRMTLWEYDYLKPNADISANLGEEAEEVYDFPGGYREADEGERRVRLLLEAEEAGRQIGRGVSTASGLVPGCHFKLEEHFQKDANGKYLITRVDHMVNAGGYRAWENDAALDYHNEFYCIPHATPYRAPRRTPRPVVQGSQSALVVGPKGEEVHVDNHGRIKVQFYWDRDGQRDEKSSCWVRVTTPWGGKGWGSVSIPRIGNEVIVAFEEGDPDRPLVIGSVYNADQTPPFGLPGAGIQMGMKSRSSPGGGGMNEFTMTDKKGAELVNVHAQYNMDTTIENNETRTIVSGTQTVTVKGDTSLTVQAGKRSVDVSGGDYDVQSTDAVKIHGKGAGVQVKGDAAGVSVTGVGGSGVSIDGTPSVLVKGAATAETKAPVVAVQADASYSLKSPLVTVDAGATAVLKSPLVDIGDSVINIHGSAIVLSAGGGTITIDASGVSIMGAKITSAAAGPNVVMGAVVQIN